MSELFNLFASQGTARGTAQHRGGTNLLPTKRRFFESPNYRRPLPKKTCIFFLCLNQSVFCVLLCVQRFRF